MVSVTVLPNGRVVSGSDDKTVRIWNPSSGECELELKGHTSVSSLHFLFLLDCWSLFLCVFVAVFFVATGCLGFQNIN